VRDAIAPFAAEYGALADAALEARAGARVDDAGVDLAAGLRAVAPVRAGVARGAEVALQVNAHDGVPLLFRGADEHPVADEAGVVHDDVEAAERVDRRGDEAAAALPVAHVVGVGDRLAAERTNLGDDLFRRSLRRATAVELDADVVDDDLRALAREARARARGRCRGRRR
jgi:hypothetical protein